MDTTKNEHIFGGGVLTNNTSSEIWEKAWSKETHETEFAQKRIKSAKSAKLTPIKIDKEDCYGYFQGSRGRYETFLDTCPCGDFMRNKLPCKHIYRLAIELDLLDEKAESNSNAIPTPKKEKATLDEEIDIVESLSENAQYILRNVAEGVKSTTPIVFERYGEEVEELLKSGIVSDTGERNLVFGKKAEIVELLESENIPFKKNDSVKLLKEICAENIKDKAMEKFGYLIGLTIPTKYTPQHIHFYLSRKFEISQPYSIYHETGLPNDYITQQLIKRGYCKIEE